MYFCNHTIITASKKKDQGILKHGSGEMEDDRGSDNCDSGIFFIILCLIVFRYTDMLMSVKLHMRFTV